MSKGNSVGSLPGSMSARTRPAAATAVRAAQANSLFSQHGDAQKAAPPIPWGQGPNLSAAAAPCLERLTLEGVIDVSVLLGTVNRPHMVKSCIEAVRLGLGGGLAYEIVVAYGDENEPALPWLQTQPDVVPVLGGREGAIPAFNRAYDASRGMLVCQINDDVLVDPGSILRAVAHLDAQPACAAVVFSFDRSDGQQQRYEYLDGEAGKLHPNFIVARRSTCEAVIERIGAFWGDRYHRTHKTYGGDSAFGVICHHLGLRLDAVKGVACRDRQNESNDALRAANQPPDDHGDRWRAMFQPLLQSRAPAPVVDTGRPQRIAKLDPIKGAFPAHVTPRHERVLHVHLATPDDPQAGLCRALRGLGDYARVDWPAARDRGTLSQELLALANRLRPTLVFMQLQTPGVLGPDFIAQLRPLLAPAGLVVTWCGDVAAHNSPWSVEWQVPLGQAVDLTLHSSFTHVKALRQAGVLCAAYLQIGYDPVQYRPAPDVEKNHDVCFLGNRYYSPEYLRAMKQHDAGLRDAVIGAMKQAFGSRFALYGNGHPGGLGPLHLSRAHEAYWRAKMGLNISLCNFFEAYSSDRIFRILGCGALLLTKRFPLLSTFGLRHAVNCLVWDTPDEAVSLARAYAAPDREAKRAEIAAAGAQLAAEHHSWDMRMKELAALLAAARGRP